MALPGLIHVASGLLVLAGLPQDRLQCAVPTPPKISINAHTEEVRYDFSRSSAQLGQIGGAAAMENGPYAGRKDAMTGGLRKDRPEIKSTMRIGHLTDPNLNQACLWYTEINVDISLAPQIYIARENGRRGPCREAVLEHERRHVKVDRAVMNDYAADLGRALQNTVNEVGAVGPVDPAKLNDWTADLENRVTRVIEAHTKAMEATMDAKQMQVDSMAEYDRVSGICNKDPNARLGR